MSTNMNISNLLIHLACNIINDDLLIDLLKSQPEKIRSAIEANDINQFKSCITNKHFFANSCEVTTY